MIGITLLPEQIRAAPPEIRRWLEAEVAATFSSAPTEPMLPREKHHLVACTIDEARAILSLIQGMLPVVHVFFELGRDPVAVLPEGLRALRLDLMMQHAHLASPDQLIACLEAIDAALVRVRGEPGGTLTAIDNSGHCLVADETARSIFTLWREIVAAHQLSPGEAPFSSPFATTAPPAAPYAISVAPMATETPSTAPAGNF